MLCFVGMMIAVGVGVKNKPTSQIICGSGIRTAGNTAKQLDASLRKGGLGTGTNPAACTKQKSGSPLPEPAVWFCLLRDRQQADRAATVEQAQAG